MPEKWHPRLSVGLTCFLFLFLSLSLPPLLSLLWDSISPPLSPSPYPVGGKVWNSVFHKAYGTAATFDHGLGQSGELYSFNWNQCLRVRKVSAGLCQTFREAEAGMLRMEIFQVPYPAIQWCKAPSVCLGDSQGLPSQHPLSFLPSWESSRFHFFFLTELWVRGGPHVRTHALVVRGGIAKPFPQAPHTSPSD